MDGHEETSSMTSRWWLLTSVMLGALGCAHSSTPGADAPDTAPAPQYFVGTTATSSPDGLTPYGAPQRYFAKRTFDLARRLIVEEVSQDGMVSVTTLTQRGTSPTFDAADAARTFTGAVTYSGDPFGLTEWDYDLILSEGATIRGHGVLTTTGLEARKTYYGADGRPVALIVDHLERVSAEAFATARDSRAPPR